MATSSSVASSVDVLSSVERSIVVAALQLKLQSIGRAGKAASNPAIRSALAAEGADVESLIVKFR